MRKSKSQDTVLNPGALGGAGVFVAIALCLWYWGGLQVTAAEHNILNALAIASMLMAALSLAMAGQKEPE
jgi:hypothetical protein